MDPKDPQTAGRETSLERLRHLSLKELQEKVRELLFRL